MYQQHIQSPTQTDCDKSITNTVRRHSTRTSKTKHSVMNQNHTDIHKHQIRLN